MSTRDFIGGWRHQLGMSGKGSNSRRRKVAFLLAVAAGEDQFVLQELARNVGLFCTNDASELAKATVAHLTNHLSDKPEEAAELRRQLGELVPEDERPSVEPAPAN